MLKDKLNSLNKREKALAVAVVFAVSVWFIYGAVIEPFYRKWQTLSKTIEISTVELQKAVKIFKQREYVLAEYDKYLASFAVKQSDEEEMALILNEIEAQARKSYVKILNMKPRKAVKNAFYKYFYVDLDTEASMQGMLKFVKELKDSKLSLSVEQLTLNSRTQDPSILVGKVTISRLGIHPEE